MDEELFRSCLQSTASERTHLAVEIDVLDCFFDTTMVSGEAFTVVMEAPDMCLSPFVEPGLRIAPCQLNPLASAKILQLIRFSDDRSFDEFVRHDG